jgi:hypothetical protein
MRSKCNASPTHHIGHGGPGAAGRGGSAVETGYSHVAQEVHTSRVFSKVCLPLPFVTVVVTFGKRWCCRVPVVAKGTSKQDRGGARANARGTAWLAWSLAALCVAMFVAVCALSVLAQSAQSPGSWITVSNVSETLSFVPFLAFPLVGALLASRRPENSIGWILLADGLLWMVLAVTDQYSIYGVASPGSVPFPIAVGTIGNQWLWIPTVGLLGIYLLLLFPDGRLPSRRWRPLAWFAGVEIIVSSVIEGLAPGPLENQGSVPNPFGLEALPWLQTAAYITLPLLPLCILAAAVGMAQRYRSSRGEVRQQIKWVAFVASFAGLLYLGALVSPLIFQPEMLSGGGRLPPIPIWLELLFSVAVLGFAGIPLAIGFAMLKYRLYDIDIIINRALVYGALTATLALIYVGSVVGLQSFFRTLTGQESTLAVVASTLLIAALFTPFKRLIQSFIDRRFYRRKYDARKTLEAFSAKLRDATDLDALDNELVGMVRETMQPAHVSLWLRPLADVGWRRESPR